MVALHGGVFHSLGQLQLQEGGVEGRGEEGEGRGGERRERVGEGRRVEWSGG